MSRPDPPAVAARPMIDIGRALRLLATAAEQPTGRLLDHVLAQTRAGGDDPEALSQAGVYQLYVQGRLPLRLTLGGLVVLDAAQRAQDRGYAPGDARDYAIDVAARFVDLLPAAAFPGGAAAGDLPPPPSPPSLCESSMRIPARQLTIGDVVLLNGWRLHVTAVEHDLATAIGTAEFDFLLHFTHDDLVEVVGDAQESAAS